MFVSFILYCTLHWHCKFVLVLSCYCSVCPAAVVLEVYDMARPLQQSLARTSHLPSSLKDLKDLGAALQVTPTRILASFRSLPHAHMAMAVPSPHYKLRLLQVRRQDSM